MRGLSTGDLIRAQIEDQTPLVGRIGGYYTAGEPVPGGVVMDLLVPHMRTAGGFALDDFPANAAQAVAQAVAQTEAQDDEPGERGAGPLHHVIPLEGPTDDELVERVLSGRVHGRATDFVYHLTSDPPPKASERLDPGPFERREEETPKGCSGGARGPAVGSTRCSRSATESGAC